jgi:hypothetical protein
MSDQGAMEKLLEDVVTTDSSRTSNNIGIISAAVDASSPSSSSSPKKSTARRGGVVIALAFRVEQLKLFHNKMAVLDSICVKGSHNRIAPGDRCLVHVRGPTVRELCEDVLRRSNSNNTNHNNTNTKSAFAATSFVHIARWVPTSGSPVLGVRIDGGGGATTMERNRRGDRLIECKEGDIVRFAERVNGGHIEEEFYDDDDDDVAHANNNDIRDKEERHRILASWLVETYGIDALSKGSGVLDVAGGNGELSRALRHLGVPSVVLDPNPRIIDNNDNDEPPLRVLPYALYGDGRDLTSRTDEIGEMVRTCSFVVGMHPDQATEAIVDMALRLGTNFAVVPCCVMPTLFPSRRQRIGGDPVRSHSAFCNYLLDKAPTENDDDELFEKISLPFVGRNKVIFSRKY